MNLEPSRMCTSRPASNPINRAHIASAATGSSASTIFPSGRGVPEPFIILVDEETIVEQQITFTLAGRVVAARPGLQFGSALVTGEVLDWLPGTLLGRVRNLSEFAGLLAFDKWTGNADGRQVVFHKKPQQRKFDEACEAGSFPS